MTACIQQCPSVFPTQAFKGYCRDGYCENTNVCRLRCDPFTRVYNVPTKSYMLKSCTNTCAPQDSLDLALTACYDHHRQWWAPRSQTVMQCETYRLFPWGRCQTRLCKTRCDDPCNTCNMCLPEPVCVSHEHLRNDCNHVSTQIASPHISSTNRGYGRSCLGNFYNC